MIVLRAIGRFFARIGRWIKDTAWVQPLLIVGGIFLIIFSIPYISKWVSSWFSSDNITAYFNKHKINLTNAETQKSDADELMQYALNYSSTSTDPQQANLKNKYGTKFFLTFVKNDCDGCKSTYEAFDYLENNFGKSVYTPADSSEKFKLYSIFTDSLNGSNEELFQKYFFGKYYDRYFEEVSGALTNSYYYIHQGGDNSSYATELAKVADVDNFAVPTIFMIDLEYDCPQANQMGVVDFLPDIPGKDGGTKITDQALTLFDCWEHKGTFAKDSE